MNMLLVVTIISAVASAVLGGYTLKFNPKEKLNQYFAIFCFTVSAWMVCNYVSLVTLDIFVVRFIMGLAALQILSLFLFAYSFAVDTVEKKIMIIATIIGIIAIIDGVSPLVFKSIVVDAEYPYPILGHGFWFFASYSIVGFVIAALLIIRPCFTYEYSAKKIQARIISTSLVVTMTLVIFFSFIVVNVWQTNKFVPVGMLSMIIFISATAYAMTRYRFLDVRIIFKKSLIYGSSLLLFTALYAVVAFILYREVDGFEKIHPLTTSIIFLLLFILLFETFRVRVRNYLDGIFFRERVDLAKLINESQIVLNSTHELETFVLQLAGSVQGAVQAPVLKIFVPQDLSKRFKSFFPAGTKDYFLFDDPIAKELKKSFVHGAHLCDELIGRRQAPHLSKLLKKYNAEMYMAAADSHGVQALVLIGKHKHNRRFTVEDIESLAEFEKLASIRIPGFLYWQYTVESLKSGLLQR